MSTENKIIFVRGHIKSCCVPELGIDLDNIPIDVEDFKVYRDVLDMQLPVLFDFIQENEDLVYAKEYNDDLLEVKARLLMLTTEVTAQNTLYRIRNEQNLRYLNEFIQANFSRVLDEEVDNYILKQYAQCLKADTWKRHIGVIHGFSRFLEIKVSSGRKMPIKWTNLILSVGLMLRECHLPTYKELSTQMFQTILSHSDPKEIKQQNIQDVIFDAVLNSLRTVDSLAGTNAIWKCLCDCLELKDDVDSYNWDLTDDLMENLMSNLKHATNTEIVICLLSFIPKILLRFSANRRQIEKSFASGYDSLSDGDFSNFRVECSKINSCAAYRWALYILKLFQAESHKLFQSPEVCEQILQRFHVCYLTCIYLIDVEVMNINLLKFLEQYSDTLMEAVAIHSEVPKIRKLVKQIYRTFANHLEKSDLEGVCKNFQPYHKAFKKFVEEKS